MNKQEIAKAIDKRRCELGITRDQLARFSDVDPKRITKMILHSDKTGYHIDTLLLLLDALGLEIVIKAKGVISSNP